MLDVAIPAIDQTILNQASAPKNGADTMDLLEGYVPPWTLESEPIYLEVCRDLGVPGLGKAQAPETGVVPQVIAGEVVPAEPEVVEDENDPEATSVIALPKPRNRAPRKRTVRGSTATR